jgi:hypothetical protein
MRTEILAAFLLVMGPACNQQAVGTSPDGGLDARPDAHSDARLDARPDARPDAAPDPCHPEALAMGFVTHTPVSPEEPAPDVRDFPVSGQVIHHGAITEPLASNPAFNREVQIRHSDASVSILQYYLPGGLQLPVYVDGAYTFHFRESIGFDHYSVGLVITRPTSGLHPLLFVGDAGPFGRALAEEDPLMSPLKVYAEDQPGCDPEPDPDCGGQRWLDRLRFDSSTGGALTDVAVSQGESAELAVFGDPFLVMNLVSWHRDPPCLDDPGYQAVYLAARLSELPARCNRELFTFWDTPYPELDTGSDCDELLVCVRDAQQAAAVMQVAPDLTCGVSDDACGPGAQKCVFDSPISIPEEIMAQVCAVSVLPDPPAVISCRAYL